MAAQYKFVFALWETFIGPLLPEIQPHGRAVLIPTGFLSLMLLHAAAVPDSSRPTGFRYALDEVAFSYAPNARLVGAVRKEAARTALATVLAVSIPLAPGAELSSQTFWSFVREFSSLSAAPGDHVRQRRLSTEWRSTVVGLWTLFCPGSCDRTRSGSRIRLESHAYARPRGQAEDHATALSDGHVVQNADRLAATRARRAASACAARSAATVSPMPKYISSGVWPRNAECGSTWLCSWT
jgi:hypothetical protein